MKKVLLAILLLLLLTGCSSKPAGNASSDSPTLRKAPSTAPAETEPARTPIVELDVIQTTNEEGRTEDVAMGNWEDTLGNMHPDALKFWVVRKEGYSRFEYIDFQLGERYTELSGTICTGCDSEPDAVTEIEIWLDGVKAYESGDISFDSHIDFSVDVTDVKVLRIECLTAKDDFGYAIVSGSLK